MTPKEIENINCCIDCERPFVEEVFKDGVPVSECCLSCVITFRELVEDFWGKEYDPDVWSFDENHPQQIVVNNERLYPKYVYAKKTTN